MQRVIFLGFAPGITNGYFVMRPDHKIELTSNIADETIFDEQPEVLEQPVEKPQEQSQRHEEPYTDKELEAVMGFEGGEGWMWGDDANKDLYFGPQDDPMAVVSRINAQTAKITDKIWQQEEIQAKEIPKELQDEIKESGQVSVILRYVRHSIGKDRQQWHLALESELQSLRDIGAIQTVQHVPRGKQVLPMKVVLTLKPLPGLTTKKKKARVCVCGNFQQNLQICSIQRTQI